MQISNPEELLKRVWNYVTPVDIELVAKRAGLEILQNEDSEGINTKVTPEGKRIIELGTDNSVNAYRYSIAFGIARHQLGYVSLINHVIHDCKLMGSFDPLSTNPDFIACNRYAMTLLMPYDAINYFVFKTSVSDIDKLAQAMKVSPAAMYYRLKHLKLV